MHLRGLHRWFARPHATDLQWRRNEIHIVGGKVRSMPEGLSRSGLWGRDGKPLPPAGGLGNAVNSLSNQWGRANRQNPAAKSFLAYSPTMQNCAQRLKWKKKCPNPS